MTNKKRHISNKKPSVDEAIVAMPFQNTFIKVEQNGRLSPGSSLANCSSSCMVVENFSIF